LYSNIYLNKIYLDSYPDRLEIPFFSHRYDTSPLYIFADTNNNKLSSARRRQHRRTIYININLIQLSPPWIISFPFFFEFCIHYKIKEEYSQISEARYICISYLNIFLCCVAIILPKMKIFINEKCLYT
jgi:hypothetical protein